MATTTKTGTQSVAGPILGGGLAFVGAGYVDGQWFGMARFSFMFGLVHFVAVLTSAVTQNLITLALSMKETYPR